MNGFQPEWFPFWPKDKDEKEAGGEGEELTAGSEGRVAVGISAIRDARNCGSVLGSGNVGGHPSYQTWFQPDWTTNTKSDAGESDLFVDIYICLHRA